MKLVRSLFELNLLKIWRREMRVWGYRLTPPSLDRLTALALHRVGLMGKEEKIAFERWVRPGMTVVDVGANQGLYSLLFSGIVGAAGAVFSFEPEPDMFAALDHNCRVNSADNVQRFEMALGSSVRNATLHRSLANGGDNRIADGLSENISKAVQIKVTSLDQIVGSRRVDFIKTDVQGWELDAFKGMDQVLRENQDVQVYFEFWPHGLRNAGTAPKDVLLFFTSRGFRLMRMVDGRETPLENMDLGQDWKPQKFTNLYARR